MLNIQLFTFNAFEENTYLLINEKRECWIIDPGMYGKQEESLLINYIVENNLTPKAIINTHAHIDHIFGVNALQERFTIPFGIHIKELEVLKYAAGSASLFGFSFEQVPRPDFYIKEGELLSVGEDMLQVYFTPGHSVGSISFYYPKGGWVISGDVLFSGSVGRTDLPGGNFDTLKDSIRNQLLTLPGETIVYPGHGPATTVQNESLNNPFLQ